MKSLAAVFCFVWSRTRILKAVNRCQFTPKDARRKTHLILCWLKPQSAGKLVPNPLAARKNRVEAVRPQTYNRHTLDFNTVSDCSVAIINIHYIQPNKEGHATIHCLMAWPYNTKYATIHCLSGFNTGKEFSVSTIIQTIVNRQRRSIYWACKAVLRQSGTQYH